MNSSKKAVKEYRWFPVEYIGEENRELIYRSHDCTFYIGECVGEDACETLRCDICGNNKMYVGQVGHITAIKCPTCEWETVIHNG